MKSYSSTRFPPQRYRGAEGFTLTELAVLLGMILVLAITLAPALAATKPNSKSAQCLNDKRQLTLAWLMCASENADSILIATKWVTGTMDWTSSALNTNTANLTNPTNAAIANYIRNANIFKCPADNYRSAAQIAASMTRVRSVSLNAAFGISMTLPTTPYPVGRTYASCYKLSDVGKPGPAGVYAFLDEHPDSINDGAFYFNPGLTPPSYTWRDLPASYHDGAVGISFADGHAEMHEWMEQSGNAATVRPVQFTPWNNTIVRSSRDYAWMNDRMPYR